MPSTFCDDGRMLSSGELAKRLHLSRCQLQYLLQAGVLPEPTHRAGGRRLFTEEEAMQAEVLLRSPAHLNIENKGE